MLYKNHFQWSLLWKSNYWCQLYKIKIEMQYEVNLRRIWMVWHMPNRILLGQLHKSKSSKSRSKILTLNRVEHIDWPPALTISPHVCFFSIHIFYTWSILQGAQITASTILSILWYTTKSAILKKISQCFSGIRRQWIIERPNRIQIYKNTVNLFCIYLCKNWFFFFTTCFDNIPISKQTSNLKISKQFSEFPCNCICDMNGPNHPTLKIE